MRYGAGRWLLCWLRFLALEQVVSAVVVVVVGGAGCSATPVTYASMGTLSSAVMLVAALLVCFIVVPGIKLFCYCCLYAGTPPMG